MPVLTLVAGPNGSGKSTITASLLASDSAAIIDPDAIAKKLQPGRPGSKVIEAGRVALLSGRSLMGKGESFVVETLARDAR